MGQARRVTRIVLWMAGTVCGLLLPGGAARAAVRCTYTGVGCNAGYSGAATFTCTSKSQLRIVITNTSSAEAANAANHLLTSLSFGGPAPVASDDARVSAGPGATLLPEGISDCRGRRGGTDVTCEWGAGGDYCANGPLCDGIDPSCRSPVPQCGLNFVSSRDASDVSCSSGNFALGEGSIDLAADGPDFGIIGAGQKQPTGNFERIRDTVTVDLEVTDCRDTTRFCAGVATFGFHFRHAPGAPVDAEPASPQPGPTSPAAVTLLGTLSGATAVPPTRSVATGQATATLSADHALTYSVNTTGFETDFLFGHLHQGASGTEGPVMLFLSCNANGTLCSGTSRALDTAERASVLAGATYFNFRSEAFPEGEIRGQLFLAAGVADVTQASVKKFDGKAKPIGLGKRLKPRPAEIRIDGIFQVSDGVDLDAPSIFINRLLAEAGGAGELTRGGNGQGTPPVILTQLRRKRGEALFVAGGDSPYHGCRMKLNARGSSTVDFTLRCKSSSGATIPVSPELCQGRRPATELTTEFIINDKTPVRFARKHPWRCMGNKEELRELRTEGMQRVSGNEKETRQGRNRPPKADFRLSPRKGTAPLTVAFTHRAEDPDRDPIAFDWNFGDGRRSVQSNPTHTYTRRGKYVVTLRVTDDQGATSKVKRATIDVEANVVPRADFRADPRSGPAPLTVRFTNRSSDREGEVAGFTWDFGDGASSTLENPTHVYRQAGRFIVTFSVTDTAGLESAPRLETITVNAVAAESNNRAPSADFRADPRQGTAPLTVQFTNRSSDPERGPLTFLWNFGDGTSSRNANPTHRYATAGRFVVTLIAVDDRGSTSSPKRETISVSANRLPVADFRADPRRGEAPLTVQFTNRSADADGEVVASTWSFGDGSGSRAENTAHTFRDPGRYTVTLSVTDDRGGVSEHPKTEVIEVQ